MTSSVQQCVHSPHRSSWYWFSSRAHSSLPELLDEVLPLLDDVDGDLQRGLLLLPEALDQILDGLHRLGVDVIQQLLLELLQPRPQLQEDTRFFGRSPAHSQHTSLLQLQKVSPFTPHLNIPLQLTRCHFQPSTLFVYERTAAERPPLCD